MISLPIDTFNLPLYEQIYRQIKKEIQKGNINNKLFSKRKLAEHLGVSINTIDTAYSQLVSEGYITSVPKKGYYVCEFEELTHIEIEKPTQIKTFINVEQNKIDFSPTGIAFEEFPFNTWRRILKNSFNQYDENILKRPHIQGLYEFRTTLAKYLYQARGVNCEPEQIVIGAGTDNLLQILGYILNSNKIIAMENPVYNKAYNIFNKMGNKVFTIETGENGIFVDELDNRNITAVYIMPSHQFPLGFSTKASIRNKLLSWSNESEGRYIIEDDYDSEFRYNTRPIPSMQSMDNNGKVIYMGTFSKAIAPSIRIGYMVLPPKLVPIYHKQCSFLSCCVSPFEQNVINSFISEGYFEKHLNKMRKIYKSKRECLVREFSEEEFEIIGESAGHHLILKFKKGMSEAQMIDKIYKAGAKVYAVSNYFIGEVPEKYKSCILLGYGSLSKKEICEGATIIKNALGVK